MRNLAYVCLAFSISVRGGENSRFYFAYGSNMSGRYLREVRLVTPIEAQKAILRSYELTASLEGVNFLEPGWVNIVSNSDEHVEGVLYELSENDYGKIMASEGNRYKILDVNLELEDGSCVIASTLKANPEGGYKLSKRYLSLLLDGADENRLSSEYVTKLKGFQTVYYPFLSELMGAIVEYAVYRKATKGDD